MLLGCRIQIPYILGFSGLTLLSLPIPILFWRWGHTSFLFLLYDTLSILWITISDFFTSCKFFELINLSENHSQKALHGISGWCLARYLYWSNDRQMDLLRKGDKVRVELSSCLPFLCLSLLLFLYPSLPFFLSSFLHLSLSPFIHPSLPFFFPLSQHFWALPIRYLQPP